LIAGHLLVAAGSREAGKQFKATIDELESD
jgi:hypothetical protein